LYTLRSFIVVFHIFLTDKMVLTKSSLLTLLFSLFADGMPSSPSQPALSLAKRQASVGTTNPKYTPSCPKTGVHMIVGSGAGGAQIAGYGLVSIGDSLYNVWLHQTYPLECSAQEQELGESLS